MTQYDRQSALVDSVAPAAASAPPLPHPRAQTPAEAGYPVPFLSPGEQTRRARERLLSARQRFLQQGLAEANALVRRVPFSPMMWEALAWRSPFLNMRAKTAVAAGGPDSFMPASFWQTQYQPTPAGWKPSWIQAKKGKPAHWSTFDHWRNCCNTCIRLIKEQSGSAPTNRVQILLEQGGKLVLQPSAAGGFALLDKYMALHKPVMIGVDFAMGQTYNRDHTTEHFVVLVGMGTEKGRKYYRFFDVGTGHQAKETNSAFKLFFDSTSNSYSGNGLLGKYTISQIRFQAL